MYPTGDNNIIIHNIYTTQVVIRRHSLRVILSATIDNSPEVILRGQGKGNYI